MWLKPTIGVGFEVKNWRLSAGYGYEINDEKDFKKITPHIAIGYVFGKEVNTKDKNKYQDMDILSWESSFLLYSTLSGRDAPRHSVLFSMDCKITNHFQTGLVWSGPPVFDDGSCFIAPFISYELYGKPLRSTLSFGSYIGLIAGGDVGYLEDVQPAKSPIYGLYVAIKRGHSIPIRVDLLRDSTGIEQTLVSFGLRWHVF